MSAITRRIAEAIDTGRAKNYSDLAHQLGVTPAAITEWRKERSAPNEDQAAALAALLGKPEVMAECMAARTRRPETRAMWERAAKTLSMATALSMVAVVLLLLTGAGNSAYASSGCNEPRAITQIMVFLRIIPLTSATSYEGSSEMRLHRQTRPNDDTKPSCSTAAVYNAPRFGTPRMRGWRNW
ncbi:DUF3693 domain-containing protein [Thauera sp. 63]|uniref:DUF3693 domain-containing protein n=1 Tax=Thauera sp. 63 TaxID=497321 RepID=UPI0009F92467|nr:DUF3693 domain-containing protein [Thauera sp. 63]